MREVAEVLRKAVIAFFTTQRLHNGTREERESEFVIFLYFTLQIYEGEIQYRQTPTVSEIIMKKMINGEPYALKGARTVLEGGRSCQAELRVASRVFVKPCRVCKGREASSFLRNGGGVTFTTLRTNLDGVHGAIGFP